MAAIILIRGAGDLASGVALRLVHCGLRVIMTELPQPLVVRRLAAFAEAVYQGQCTVEGVAARLVKDPTDNFKILMTLSKSEIPILIDPQGDAVTGLHPTAVVDARMTKATVPLDPRVVPLLIGLGPGFEAGVNCHAVIETQRGPELGRVIWNGKPLPDTGIPEVIGGRGAERVLRAPADGIFQPHTEIGQSIEAGQLIAEVGGEPVYAPIKGRLRGLLYPGLVVQSGIKVGDIDPRPEAEAPHFCERVSDKSLAVGGGVLEAVLTRAELRRHWWD